MNNEWICKKNSAEFTSHVECGKASNRRDRKSDHGIVYCVLKSAKVLTLQSKMRYLHELTGFSSTQVVEDERQQPEPQNIYISTESSTLPSWHTWQLSASLSINQDSSPTMRSPCRLKKEAWEIPAKIIFFNSRQVTTWRPRSPLQSITIKSSDYLVNR